MKDLLATIDLYDDDDTRVEFNKGGDAERKRRLQIAYDKYGKDSLDKGAKVLGFKNFESMRGEKNANFRRKIFKELEEFGEVMTEEGSRQRSRVGRIQTEQDIQIKLLEETNKKKFFDPVKFAKANNISLPELKKQSALLQKNIYNKRMKMAGKDMRFQLNWIPDDPTASDNTLNKLWKSKLIKYDKNKIDELFYQAFGNPKSNTYNPKKFLAIKKNLNEYRQLREAINAKYPNINFELDHPLSKSTLNKVFNATADQLTFVNPLTKDLNNGFKDSLSLQYEKAIQGNNTSKKKAVEKIARDLKLNIGKVSDDATNFKYGVKEFQKLDMKEELLKAVRTQADLSSNLKTYVKNNPDLFKQAGVSPNINLTNIKPSEVKGVEKILARYAAIGCGPKGVKQGGRIGFNIGTSTTCIRQGLEKVRSGTNLSPGDQANIKAINNITKTAKGAKAIGTAARVLGAGVIAPEIVFGGFFAATDYATGADKDEIISNLTFGLGGKSMKEQLKESDPKYGQADKLTDVYQGYLNSLDKFGKPKPFVGRPGKRTSEQDVLKAMEPFTRVNPQLETGDFFDLGMYESQLEKDRAAEAKFAEDKIQRALERGFYDPGVGGSRRISEFQAAGGGIAKEAGDPSGAMLESMNPDSQGLSGLLKRAKKV